jgi:hypothetical protein
MERLSRRVPCRDSLRHQLSRALPGGAPAPAPLQRDHGARHARDRRVAADRRARGADLRHRSREDSASSRRASTCSASIRAASAPSG